MLTKTFRRDINGLRAIAVGCVVLFHAGLSHLGGGFIGVDIFFVISGFLMTQIIVNSVLTGKMSIVQFYGLRAVRIVPALLAMVALLLVFGLVFIEPKSLETLARHSFRALLFVSNIEFWQEAGYFDLDSRRKWLLHTWSLSVEWQFYMLYPLVLAGLARLRGSAFARRAGLLAAFALSLGASIWLGADGRSGTLRSFAFFMLPTRAWEMIAGGLVFEFGASTARRSMPAAVGAAAEAAGLLLLGAGLMLVDGQTPWPSWRALLPVAGTALVLVAARDRSLLAREPLQILGSMSYSVYLWHWPIVVWFDAIALAPALKAAAVVAISLASGALSYWLVEQGAVRRALSTAGAWPRRLARLGVPLALVLGVSVATKLSHGFPHRIQGDARVYDDAVAAPDDHGFPYGRCGGFANGVIHPCFSGRDNHADVAVIGDSFGEIWFKRASRLRTANGDHALVFLTLAGCPPVEGVYRPARGDECEQAHRQFVQIASQARYRRVVIVAMWTSYFRNGRSDVRIAGAGRDLALGSAPGLDAAMAALADEVGRYEAAGKEVVIIGTTPYPDVDIPLAVREAEFRGRSLTETFDFRRTLAATLPIEERLKALAGPHVKVIDTKPFFCPHDACRQTVDRRSVYTDHAHLRASFLDGLPQTPVDAAAFE